MSSRTGSVLVGAFAVGALVIAVAGGLFFAGGGIGKARMPVVMAFDGSLRGLNAGAPVALRGVTIGEVTDIDLRLNAEAGQLTMLVTAEIDPSTVQLVGDAGEDIAAALIERGLVAQLELQSLLTGLLFVQLDFRTDVEPRIAELDEDIVQIPTIPTELEQLLASLEEIDYQTITQSLDRIAAGLDSLVNNSDTQALPAELRATLTSVNTTLASVDVASRQLEETLDSNAERLTVLLDTSTEAMETLNTRLPELVATTDRTLRGLDRAIGSAESSLAQIERATAPESAPRQQLSAALQELSLAARALRSLANSLEEYPESLLRGRSAEGGR